MACPLRPLSMHTWAQILPTYSRLPRPMVSGPAPFFNQIPYYGCFLSICTGSEGRTIHTTSYNRCKITIREEYHSAKCHANNRTWKETLHGQTSYSKHAYLARIPVSHLSVKVGMQTESLQKSYGATERTASSIRRSPCVAAHGPMTGLRKGHRSRADVHRYDGLSCRRRRHYFGASCVGFRVSAPRLGSRLEMDGRSGRVQSSQRTKERTRMIWRA